MITTIWACAFSVIVAVIALTLGTRNRENLIEKCNCISMTAIIIATGLTISILAFSAGIEYGKNLQSIESRDIK